MKVVRRTVLVWFVALLVAGPLFAEVREYELWATDGFVTMSDGTVKYAFGFNDTGVLGQLQFPSPLIWANVGDEVRITLHNIGFAFRPDLTDPHTIHLHGIHVVPYYDGFGESSFEIDMNESFTYKFIAGREGSYMYHCHVEAVEHVQMGMYGPLIIYGEDGPGTIYDRPYTKEYVWLISEFDSRWHQSLEPGFVPPAIPAFAQTDPPIAYDQWVRVNFRPDYWLINGLGFPDTIKTDVELPILTANPDPATFPDAPAIVGIQNGIAVANPGWNGTPPTLQQSALLETETDQDVLVRLIHMGFESHPLHMHGVHFELIGSDATPRPHVQAADDDSSDDDSSHSQVSEQKFTILIGSGETYDTIVRVPKRLQCISDSLVPKPEVVPPGAVLTPVSFYDPTPDGYWWYPMHCHDDYHVADQGIYPTGMLTLLKLKKPDCSSAGGSGNPVEAPGRSPDGRNVEFGTQ